MKDTLSLLLALAAGQTGDLPHAFPREEAREVFDNERVTIWDVSWIKGRA